MGKKLSKINDMMTKFNDENEGQSITTITGKHSGAFNRFMFIVFSCLAIFPILIMLLGGSLSQLFLSPFGFFMAIQYRRRIKDDNLIRQQELEKQKKEDTVDDAKLNNDTDTNYNNSNAATKTKNSKGTFNRVMFIIFAIATGYTLLAFLFKDSGNYLIISIICFVIAIQYRIKVNKFQKQQVPNND